MGEAKRRRAMEGLVSKPTLRDAVWAAIIEFQKEKQRFPECADNWRERDGTTDTHDLLETVCDIMEIEPPIETFEKTLNCVMAMCVIWKVIDGIPEIAEYMLAHGRPAPWLKDLGK
jgi:hypothetical protein